jgi:hypothetical protein
MPRKTSTPVPDTSGTILVPLESIPQDVKNYVEEVYKRQLVTPGRERAEYDTEAEMNTEWKFMTDYAAQRPQGLGGVLKIRRSPTRDLPVNVMDFRVTANVEANGTAKTDPNGNKADARADATKK